MMSFSGARIGIAATIILATAAWDLPPWMQKGPDWAPLSAEEIADAHPCSMDSMIAICAGEKRIATGIIVATQKVGIGLSREAEVVSHRWPQIPVSPSAFIVDAMVEIKQSAASGGHEWRATYYVISGEQLGAIIAKARAEPEWKP